MDCLECKICNIPYDEEDHKPRNSPCGHELCTTCLGTLINNGLFVCPKCRKGFQVYTPVDLPVCFALIDVIRAFKEKKNPFPKETEPRTSGTGATHGEVCNVHGKTISHWCFKCLIWICGDCLESHNYLIGCSTTISTKAMKNMKEKHIKDLDMLLTIFEEDANCMTSKIKEHTDKRKELLESAEKHGEEVKKLRISLEQGNIHKNTLAESIGHLNTTKSPSAVSEKIKVVNQRKLSLRSWSVKNLGMETLFSLPKTLKEKAVYAEMIINDQKQHAKLSKHVESIYFHTFKEQKVADDCICMTFDRLQKIIPEDASLVLKGRLLVRLDKKMPNIREYFTQIVTGQHGVSLNGRPFTGRNVDDISVGDLPFSEMSVIRDNRIKSNIVKRGEVIGYFSNGYLEDIHFYIGTKLDMEEYGNGYSVFGKIEDGLDILQECHMGWMSRNINISDCGLVIEQD